jgi:non-homologous end joining protein Ku
MDNKIGTRKVGAARTKLTLKFGNIPVEGRLTRFASETESGLSQFSPAGNPIGYKKVDKVTGAEVSNDQILKGKKIGDTVVTFTEDELDSAYVSRQAEVSNVKPEDIQDIPATYIKSLYYFKPENETFWGMIGGRLEECKKQLRFVYVEGRQERTAILRVEGGMGVVYVLYFPSEVAEIKGVKPPVCKPELMATVDTLLTALSGKEIPEPEEKRNVVIDQLVEMKLTGKPIPVRVAPVATVVAGKSMEELLKESIAMVSVK